MGGSQDPEIWWDISSSPGLLAMDWRKWFCDIFQQQSRKCRCIACIASLYVSPFKIRSCLELQPCQVAPIFAWTASSLTGLDGQSAARAVKVVFSIGSGMKCSLASADKNWRFHADSKSHQSHVSFESPAKDPPAITCPGTCNAGQHSVPQTNLTKKCAGCFLLAWASISCASCFPIFYPVYLKILALQLFPCFISAAISSLASRIAKSWIAESVYSCDSCSKSVSLVQPFDFEIFWICFTFPETWSFEAGWCVI